MSSFFIFLLTNIKKMTQENYSSTPLDFPNHLSSIFNSQRNAQHFLNHAFSFHANMSDSDFDSLLTFINFFDLPPSSLIRRAERLFDKEQYLRACKILTHKNISTKNKSVFLSKLFDKVGKDIPFHTFIPVFEYITKNSLIDPYHLLKHAIDCSNIDLIKSFLSLEDVKLEKRHETLLAKASIHNPQIKELLLSQKLTNSEAIKSQSFDIDVIKKYDLDAYKKVEATLSKSTKASIALKSITNLKDCNLSSNFCLYMLSNLSTPSQIEQGTKRVLTLVKNQTYSPNICKIDRVLYDKNPVIYFKTISLFNSPSYKNPSLTLLNINKGFNILELFQCLPDSDIDIIIENYIQKLLNNFNKASYSESKTLNNMINRVSRYSHKADYVFTLEYIKDNVFPALLKRNLSESSVQIIKELLA